MCYAGPLISASEYQLREWVLDQYFVSHLINSGIDLLF